MLLVLVGDIKSKTIQLMQLSLDLLLALGFKVEYLTGGFLPFDFGLMLKGLNVHIGEVV